MGIRRTHSRLNPHGGSYTCDITLMYKRTEEVGPTVGLPRHRHFVGFFNVTVQAPTRRFPFTVIPRNRPISVAFTTHMRIRRTYSYLKQPCPSGMLFREIAPFQSPFTTRTGVWRTCFRLKSPGPHGSINIEKNYRYRKPLY